MIIRSAQFLGSVAAEHQAYFDRVVDEQVRQEMLQFPEIRNLEILRRVDMDAGARPIYQIYNLSFDDIPAMERALASPIRAAVYKAMQPILPLFEGEIVHYVLSSDHS